MRRKHERTGQKNKAYFFVISFAIVSIAGVLVFWMYTELRRPHILREMQLQNQSLQFRLEDFAQADIPYVRNSLSWFENTLEVTGRESETVFLDYFDRNILGYERAYLYQNTKERLYRLYGNEPEELPGSIRLRFAECRSPYPIFFKSELDEISFYSTVPGYPDWVFYCVLSDKQAGSLREKLNVTAGSDRRWCVIADDGVVIESRLPAGFLDFDEEVRSDSGGYGSLRTLLGRKSVWTFSGRYGDGWLASFTRIGGSNLLCGAFVRASQVYKGFYKPLVLFLAVCGTIFYFAFLLGWHDSIRIRHPLERIARNAERFVRSEFYQSDEGSSRLEKIRFEFKHGSAIERLERVFDALTQELQELHYRRIRTNIHLLNLNEINRMVRMADDFKEALANVTAYVAENLAFPILGFSLIDRSAGSLEGRIACRKREYIFTFSVPLETDDSFLLESLRRTGSRRLGIMREDALLGGDLKLPDDFSDPALSYMIIPIKSGQEFIDCWNQTQCDERDCPAFDNHESVCYTVAGVTCKHAGPPEEAHPLRRCMNCELYPVLGAAFVGYRAETRQFKLDILALETFVSQIGILVRNERLYRDLQKGEEFRTNIMESMSSGLVSVDLSGRIISINKLGAEILGTEPESCLGGKLEEHMHIADNQLNPILQTLSTKRYFLRQELTLEREREQTMILSVNTSLLRDEQDEVYGAVGELNNISNLRKMEEELRQLEKLAALGRFTTSVAHEIRNPLGGIGTGIQYLRKGLDKDDKNRETIDFIEREIERLDRIIVDLYKVSSPSPLMLMETSIWSCIDWAARSLGGEYAAQDVKLKMEGDRTLAPVMMDCDKIEQVLINLLKNALQASSPGMEVVIEARSYTKHPPPVSSGLKSSHIRITVEDHGEGIQEDDIPKVFEPFFSKKEGGTGLGLFISYSIAERHGGEILVDSKFGEGTKFILDLPISLQPAEGIQ